MEASDHNNCARSGALLIGELAHLRNALRECEAYPHIRVVRDYSLLRRIGQLRYQQYVVGQGKTYKAAVLDPDCLIELTDFSGVNICAVEESGLTAAMRIGHLTDINNPQMPLLLEAADAAGIDPRITTTCSRLVRSPNHKGQHAADLICFARLQTVMAGYRYCVMQTAERLVPYFKRFEFYETGRWTEDSIAGCLQTMILDTKLDPIRNRRIEVA